VWEHSFNVRRKKDGRQMMNRSDGNVYPLFAVLIAFIFPLLFPFFVGNYF
jgi:hypothetical protein